MARLLVQSPGSGGAPLRHQGRCARSVTAGRGCADDDGRAGPVRLLIFGDSWARSAVPGMRTWPQLLGDQLEWRSLNVAMPGSSSVLLSAQADTVAAKLLEGGLTLHEDAWALVHTGGVDMLRGMSTDFYSFAINASLSSLCCCSPCCCRMDVFEEVADNVEALVHRLRDELGVRHIILVGLPLSIATPFTASFLDAVFRERPCLRFAAGFVVQRLNHVHMAALRRRLARLHRGSIDGVVFDEAAAIDACIGAHDGAFDKRLWADGLHPTQLGHEALGEQGIAELEDVMLIGGPSRRTWWFSGDSIDSDESENAL